MAVDLFGISGAISRADIGGAIKRAASATGASFQYLLTTAKMESNFKPTAAATTSSARGLFQFIDQTWLGTVKEAGAALGYGNYAKAIEKTAEGGYAVSDPATRREILKLRDDPEAASAMAGVLSQSNALKLSESIGRRPSDGELYMAHFMGVGGAAKLITAAQDSPQRSAAALFPAAAAANRSIFYDRDGSARSVSGVYSVLSERYAAAANATTPQTVQALSAPVAPAAFLSRFPDTRDAPAVAAPSAQVQNEPMFRTLFQTGARNEPIAPAVRELWGNGTSLSSAQSNGRAAGALDLFSDRSGQFSG